MRKFTFAAAAATALFFMVSSASSQGRPAGVSTDTVTTREIAETVSVFGQVIAGRQSDVATRVMGVAAVSPLRVGDQVAAGDIVFRLNTERLEIELEQAQAELTIAEAGVEAAKARRDTAQKVFDRTRTLAANSTVSQAQLDDRSGDLAEALANLQQAEARITAAIAGLHRAEYDIENAVIRAPFGGTVLDVTAEVGEFVSTGSVVVQLLDTSALEIEANVPSRLVNSLRNDQPVMARTDTGDELTLMLRAVLPTEFSATRTRPVRFQMEASDVEVAVGQNVTVDVPISLPEEVLVVSKDAVVQARGGWQVFVNDGGKASPRTVEIGRSIGDAFEVLSGLSEGDEVVTRGNERLRPGQDIAPQSGSGG